MTTNGPMQVFAISQESLDYLKRKHPQFGELLRFNSDFVATYETTGEVTVLKTRRTPQPDKPVSAELAGRILRANVAQAGFVSLEDLP